MRLRILLSAAIVVLLLSAPAFGQTRIYSTSTANTSSDTYNARAIPVNPHSITNNSLPTGPGIGFDNPSQWGRANAVFVLHEIAKARADGRNVRVAEAQYGLAMNELNHGLNKEAAQHFDSALRTIGIQPNVQGENAGEPLRPHLPMPGAAKP